MISSASPGRKIASNRLFTGRELLSDPLVTIGAEGEILAVEQCAAPDRCAGVEFFAGVLTPGLVDVCCGMLTMPLRHRNAGTRYVVCSTFDAQVSTRLGFTFRLLAPESVFLSRFPAGIPFPENTPVIIDIPLSLPDADRFAARPPVCLCPRAVGSDRLPETLALLRQWAIVPALGSYAPDELDMPLGEMLHLLSGEPVVEVLAWATGQGARMGGFGTIELTPGSRCGLNLLSGLDYPTMRLTSQTRLTRIL